MEPKLDAIGVVVSDLNRAVEFFRILGVEFEEPGDSPHIEATLPNGLRLMLDTEELVKQFMPDWEKPIGQGIGLAFLCENAAAVDATYQKVLDAGFTGKKEPWDAFWGQRYAMVQDADGYSYDLFAPLEESS